MKKIVALILALVMVMGLATVASAATAAQSSDAGVAAAVTTTTAKMQDLAPQVDASKTFATYGLLVTDNTTKTVTSYGPFNKVPSATNATWTYVDGTTIVYLTDKVTGATWNQKAEAVKVGYNVAAYAECGEFYVDDPAEVGTYYLFDKVFYEECDYMTAATITFNVDGMVVWAKVTDKVHYQDHSYKVDTVKTNATVGIAASKVYCSACEKVFDFVDGTEAMAIAKFGVGNYD